MKNKRKKENVKTTFQGNKKLQNNLKARKNEYPAPGPRPGPGRERGCSHGSRSSKSFSSRTALLTSRDNIRVESSRLLHIYTSPHPLDQNGPQSRVTSSCGVISS